MAHLLVGLKTLYERDAIRSIAVKNTIDQNDVEGVLLKQVQRFVGIIQRDPAVQTVVGFVNGGRGGGGGGFVFLSLKPRSGPSGSTATPTRIRRSTAAPTKPCLSLL